MIESVVRLRRRTAATLWITLVRVAAGAWLTIAAVILAIGSSPFRTTAKRR